MTSVERASSGRHALSGVAWITSATLIAGVAAYAITWLVPRVVGPAQYVSFAVFWSALYLVVGGLSGIQQEVTRGTRRVDFQSDGRASRARNFGLSASLAVVAAILATSPLWARFAFPEYGWQLVLPLAIGTGSYVLVAVLAGSLYGLTDWVAIAALIGVDAVMRLAAIGLSLVFTTDIVVLAWAVVAPFPLTLMVVWATVRRSVVGRTELDVAYQQLTWNVVRTVAAAVSMGVMVSGFPLLLGLTSQGESKTTLSMLILSISLVRSPLVVIVLSLQSFLIVRFRDRAAHMWRTFLTMSALIVGVALVLAILAWFVGPPIFGFLFPQQVVPPSWFFAVLIASSALVGVMCVSAPAVLARSKHLVYAAGWFAGAVVTAAILLTPVRLVDRTALSLLIGPCVGLAVHLGYLVASRRSASFSSSEMRNS